MYIESSQCFDETFVVLNLEVGDLVAKISDLFLFILRLV